MDNFAHTLAAVSVAKGISIQRPQWRGTWLLWASVLGNNFPDLDYLWTSLTGGKLGYLLHHRGHTHTFLGLLPQWFFILLILWIVSRWKKTHLSSSEWQGIAGVSALGLLLHIFFDSWNSYGVHPLWPMSSDWIYGDSVFILEPVLWMLWVPVAVRSVDSKLMKWIFGSVGALGAILMGTLGRYSWEYFAGAAIIQGFWYFWASRAAFKRLWKRAMLASVLWVALLLTLSPRVKNEIQQQVKPSLPGGVWLDLIGTAAPANPFCWWFQLIESNGDVYRIHRSAYSLWPKGFSPSECEVLKRSEATVPLHVSELPSSENFSASKRMEGRLGEIQALKAQSCFADAALRFMRAPYYLSDQKILGDFRYDSEKGLGFADLEIPQDSLVCPQFVPCWNHPFAGFKGALSAKP